MSQWQDISTAPRLRPILIKDACGEVFVGKYDENARFMYRMHALRTPEHHRIVKAEMDGKPVEAYVPIGKPWRETYEHNWVLWTRGFDFNPEAWSELPEPSP